MTLRALLAKYRTDSTGNSGSSLKKRSAGGPSSGSGSSSSSSSSGDSGHETKPSGGFPNGSGDGNEGGGHYSNDYDGMEHDATLEHNKNEENDQELHVTPRSLISHDQNNGLIYATLPNRLVFF